MRSREDYLNRLSRIYAGIPKDKREIADEMLQRLADTLCMMDECKEDLLKNGCVTEQNRGKYTIIKENPASSIYDAKYKLMLSTMEKLDRMLPGVTNKKDELLAFLDGDEA